MGVSNDDAIVRPSEGVRGKDLAPLAVMVSSDADIKMLSRRLCTRRSDAVRLFNSRVYTPAAAPDIACLVGPMIGAPYAVMVLETLIARGVNTVLFFGWCGAISPKVKIGDIIIPTGAMIDEGTSPHYHPDASGVAQPAGKITDELKRLLTGRTVSFHEGCIWTTDAVYRETCQKVLSFQRQSVLAVEMEMSALFTVARYRDIQIGGILVVSDDLSTLKWQSGFTTNPFQNGRIIACEVIEDICNTRHHHPFGKK